jgi:hypothetical protein
LGKVKVRTPIEIGGGLVAVEMARREGEGARVVADVVLGIDGLHVLVLREVDASVDPLRVFT